ncbi:hypothetical protein H0H81_001535 [Sphagnurus paluster]|uniref:AMP-dependent synthetase/ligase domain-containing protein n=1 Tax=Sphagnurus paluster TaxID=117069 RepID=A0A9P7FVR6_9AGAR|nr:hypothetical protein H0H81_001535 [Sphagnurus paluster]
MPFVTPVTIPWPENAPYDKQSVAVPGTKRPGQTAHYRNGIWGLVDVHTPKALKTVDEIFETGLAGGRDRPLLGERPILIKNPLKFANHYSWLTYGEVDIRRRYVGSALLSMFASGQLGGGEFDTVGIWSANRPVEEYGKANLAEPIRAKPETMASICYTSGTTNNPKGVVLTHANFALSVHSNLYGLELPEDAIIMSYLPLAHIYERVCELCVIAVSGKIGYFTGDPLRLLEDAQLLKPNFFPSVPRVLNRIFQAAMAGGNVPGLKGNLFRKAIQVKLDRLHTTGDPTHFFWDKLVFRKIQAVLGGQIKLMSSGSAPISPEVMDFLKIAFACEVTEGQYGMTENCATCAKTWPNDPTSSGTVGPPQPINEVKLVDVPAMGYTSQDQPNPRGELCVRGANCFKVYYKDEQNTKETVDNEKWTHTGDVAEIDSCGRIKIIDRVKNIMKLAQGEYVALEKIENMYSSSPVVTQIYVHGDSLQSYLLAVIIPDTVQLAGIASKVFGKKVLPEDLPELSSACKDERVKQEILTSLTKEAKKNGLKGFEMIKRIHLSLDPFSVDDGTMTPTLKIRRKDAYMKFKAELDDLYAPGEPSSKL